MTLTNPDVVRTPADRAATQVVVSDFYRRRHAQLEPDLPAAMSQNPDTSVAALAAVRLLLSASRYEGPIELGELSPATGER